MRLSLASASALLLWAGEATCHAIPAADGNEIVARDQTYRASNGVQFATETGFDYHGGDYKTVSANSFHDCINVCSTQAPCRAVSYSGKSCWLKSSVNAATSNSKSSGAVRVQYMPTPIACPAAGGNQVNAADGQLFTVQCGVDHPYGDLKSVQTLDFPNCISLCSETSGCVAASWRSLTCYLKKSLQPGVANSDASTAVLSSVLPATPAFCPGPSGQQIKETSGRTFTIECNADHSGGDLANKLLSNFGNCISWCDETGGCVAAVYHDGRCWLKNKLTASSTRTNSQVAVLSSVLSPPPSLCPSQNSKQIKKPSGRSFTIACNVDRPGGDLASAKLDNFNSCIAWCDETNGCIAAAYHDGQCWLKKTLSTSSAHINGQVAVLSSKLPQTSTHSTSTSTHTKSTSTKKTTSTTTKSSFTSTPTTSTSTQHTTSTSTQTTTTTTTSEPTSTSASVSANTQSNQISTSVTTATTSSATSSSSSDTSSATGFTTSTEVTATATATTASTNAESTSTSASDSSASVTDTPTGTLGTTDTSTSISDISSQSAAPITTGASAPNGTLQTPTGAITLPPQPTVTLSPLTPPNVDVAGIAVITPQEVSQLWFGNSSLASNASAISSPTVRVNMTFEYPSVVLDNSININSVQCNSGTLSASFNGTAAYDAAKNSWAAAESAGNSSSLIIITASPGCSLDGHYVYFVASHFAFDDNAMSVSCSGSIESVSDIAQAVGVDFGSIETSVPPLQSDPELAAAYGCTSPSAADIHGLPAIYCGPDFDQRLDNQLGYYSMADADVNATLAAVIPGVENDALERRGLIERRCLIESVCKLVKKVEKVATNTYHAVANDASSIGKTLGSMAQTLGNDALSSFKHFATGALAMAENFAQGVRAAAIFLVTGDYNRSFDFPLAVAPPPSALDDSPWGDAFNFYTWTPDKGDFWNAQEEAIDKITSVLIGEADPEPSIELWCVNCHATGDLKLLGSASFSLSQGLTKAQLSMNGNLDASLYLGMNAFAEWDPTKEVDMVTMGLPELEIPNILVLGPIVSLGVSIDLDVSVVGQYLVGVDMNWPQLSATLDVLNPGSSSQSGWVPSVHDSVQADGSLTINSTLGLPITLAFGINILNGKYKKEVKLVDTPGIRASMEYDWTNEVNNGTLNTDPADDCYGIHWSIGVVNTVVLDLTEVDLGTHTLEEWDAPVFASGCIGESLSIPSPTATVAAPTGGTTSAPNPQVPCSTLSCPNDNEQYCVSNGASFQINCGASYQSVTLDRIVRTNSIDECTSVCATDGACTHVNWNYLVPGVVFRCVLYSGGPPTYNGQGGTSWSYSKVTSPQKKRMNLVQRVTTVDTSAAPTGIANSNDIVADTFSLTASSTATTTAASSTAEAGYNTAPVTITDITGQLLVNPHVNGSLFVSAANSTVSMTSLTNDTTFMADLTNPLVIGDSASRILYYFPSTMSTVGASRLRLATWDAIPIGAEMIVLFPTVTNTKETILIAMDSTQNVFFPFVCAIEGQLNKIFLVSDSTTGASTLMDPDLTYTVIGGVATSCVSLAMVAENLTGWAPPSPTGA